MKNVKLEQFAPVFEALSSKVRIGIIKFIYAEQHKYNPEDKVPLSKNHVQGITAHTGLSQPTITHHLKALKAAKLLKTVRKSKLKLVFINQKVLNELKPVIGEFIDTVNAKHELRTLDLSTEKAGLDHEQFKKAAEFVALHGFKLSQPTVNSTSHTLKFIISRRTELDRVMFLRFDQNKQLIQLSYYDELDEFLIKMADEIMLLFKKYLTSA